MSFIQASISLLCFTKRSDIGCTHDSRALELLLSTCFRKVKNLYGGINAWAQQEDSSLPIY
jgi:hypothetical protein